jgi:hypothetical protein
MSDDRLQEVNYEFIKEWRAKTGFMVDLVNLDPGPTGRHVYNEPDIWLGPGSIPKYLIDAKSKTVLINWNRPGAEHLPTRLEFVKLLEQALDVYFDANN